MKTPKGYKKPKWYRRKAYRALLTSVEHHLSDNKILLRHIEDADGNLFRDHCWVRIGRRINPLIPDPGQGTLIGFTAIEYNYTTKENKERKGLKSISCVSRILPKVIRENYGKSKKEIREEKSESKEHKSEG